MTSAPKRISARPRARKYLWRVTLDLPHLVLPEARPLHNSGARRTRLWDERLMLLLVLPALGRLLCVTWEDARVPAVLMDGSAGLRARGTGPGVAVVRRAARVVAERRDDARARAHGDGSVPLLAAGDVDVLGAAGAAHALCERTLPARP